MVIEGRWALFDDGELRPVLQIEILTADGTCQSAVFLVDTGADKSVISADVLQN